jgi:hypothetical protein
MQQGYSRTRRMQELPVAVLENRWLRAVFLLDHGGRLWSLFHKPSQTELLAQSREITYCNLALRNAWFRGGVEWNVSTTGHSPLTCSPMYAAQLKDGQGNPILRMYEWERLRQVVVQIDVYLPDSSAVLLVRPRILHPGHQAVPMYWWSNLAVPQSEGMRVLVPADSMYVLGSKGQGLRRSPVPFSDGLDVTYPSNWSHAADLFFELRATDLPWISAVSSEGVGIFHTSQSRMLGRKLWVWGASEAGRNWQEFLAPQSGRYVEIQAGLTPTQLEHVPLAAGEDRSWVEAYGRLALDPSLAHGDSWESACNHAAEQIHREVSCEMLSDVDRLLGALADTPPDAIAQRGTGWGALERRRREAEGLPRLGTPGVVFDDEALGDDQRPWIDLLLTGALPEASPDTPPNAFVVEAGWEALLERSLASGRRGPWNAWLHLGIMRRFAGDDDGAQAAWEQSLEQCWTPWAARNLAVLAWERGESERAAQWMLDACRAAPGQLDLLAECGSLLIEAGKPHVWIDLLEAVSPPLRNHGRIRLLEAQAALTAGDLAAVERFFEDRIVPDDLREGETSLEDLWFAFEQRRISCESQPAGAGKASAGVSGPRPIPAELDYVIR